MGNKNQQQKKFKFHKYQTIGAPDAESDNDLEKVFIENGEIDVLKDLANPKCIIIGRTGAGKSALIKHFEDNISKTVRIAPESMSIKYLSNSNILDYFRNLGVNLNFFYKVLWKHVFIVELLKLYFEEDMRKKESFFENLHEKIKNQFGKPNPSKQKAIKYLETWSQEFWLQTEHRVKSLENELTTKFLSETGLSMDVLNSKSSLEDSTIQKKNTEIKYKAEKVINEIQADELFEIINIMKNDLFNNPQKKFYIIIDDLDKEWVSPQIVYDLIAAMIEVIKEFQVFKSCKIVIALRDNLHQLALSGKEHRGGQREKFSSLYLNIEWTKDSLKELLDKRLKLVSNNSIDFKTVFEKENKNKETGFEYVLARTFLRPRDLISFINKIITNANSKSYFSTNLIKLAEPEYSIERFQAIEDEWAENYGDIRKICSCLIGIHNGFKIINIKEDSFYQIYCDEEYIKFFRGELYDVCHKWSNKKIKFKDFLKEIFFILYRIGIIGIKKGPEFPIQFFYDKASPILIDDFDSDVRIYIHKTFYSALKINVKEQETDYLD